MKNYITLIFCVVARCSYTPFNKDNGINSIYGTGNELLDVVYRTRCAMLCDVSVSPCCEGDKINSIKCMDKAYCQILVERLQDYLVTVTLKIYFSLVALASIVMFLLFYCLTYRNLTLSQKSNGILCNQSCWTNGIVAAILVVCTALLIPIVIIIIVARCRKISLTSLLGGDFSSISSVNLITSIEVKSETKKFVGKGNNENNKHYGNTKALYLAEGVSIPNEIDFNEKVTTTVKLPIIDKM